MTLNTDGRRAMVFDVEAAAIMDAEAYLEPPTAPTNYTKPEAIQKYVEKATVEQLAKCALDVDLARIVAIGMQWEGDDVPIVRLCDTEAAERDVLTWFWNLVMPYPFPRLIGFNLCGYDLPLILRRSLYLGVKCPSIAIGKYRHPDVDDLMLMLSFDGALKFHSLSFFCRRFGIDVPDTLTGAGIAAAVAEGRWADVEAHVTADVQKTAQLAERLGAFSLAGAVL